MGVYEYYILLNATKHSMDCVVEYLHIYSDFVMFAYSLII